MHSPPRSTESAGGSGEIGSLQGSSWLGRGLAAAGPRFTRRPGPPGAAGRAIMRAHGRPRRGAEQT